MAEAAKRFILVVDNDMKVLQMVEKALQKNKYKVHLATDGALANRGFWFDEVTLTDISVQVPDDQDDVCGPAGLIFADGFESGDASAW